MNEVLCQYATRCHICRGWIVKNDPIVFVSDHPAHPECEPSPQPWSCPPSPTHKLAAVLSRRGPILGDLLECDFDVEQLPAEVRRALFAVVAAEGSLDSLLADLASEWRDD